ncbi:alpha/beta fold hydrolase [Streptomyces sannanensis]|uniref:Alpha/beta fold hydrolase n=1 Tax=Streptomyces sannanensis TaxID=285536 RepID=A0ABP6SFN8_9ACTN
MAAVGVGDTTARWTRNRRPRAGAAVNLVCLPHAGGSAGFYRGWHDLLPREVDFHAVQYPGREDRLTEASVGTMAEMADAVTEAIRPLFARDVVLFGHSMGAAIAYEVARRCEAEGRFPRLLLVSGRGAPHRQPPGTMHQGTDDEIVARLREFSATSGAALDDPDLRALLLPMIRADYRLVETYRLERPEPVRAPIAVLRGRADDRVDEERAEAWSELTTADCEHRLFDGGHFYLQQHETQVVRTVAELVGKALR